MIWRNRLPFTDSGDGGNRLWLASASQPVHYPRESFLEPVKLGGQTGTDIGVETLCGHLTARIIGRIVSRKYLYQAFLDYG